MSKRLSTIRKTMTKSRAPVSDSKSLYLCVLQAVVNPVLSGAAKVQKAVTIKTEKSCVVANHTLYLCLASMQAFKTALNTRIKIMALIPQTGARAFCKAGLKALDVMDPFAPMTEFKELITSLAMIVSGELKDITVSSPLTAISLDNHLVKTIELFLAVIREAVTEESYEVRKHPLLQIQNLKPFFSKYFLTSSQISNDREGDLTIGVMDLFAVSQEEHEKCLRMLRTTYTEGGVFKHLTDNLRLLSRGIMPESLVGDFAGVSAHAAFTEKESKQLTSLLSVYGLSHPDAPGEASNSSPPKNLPPDQKMAEKYYKVLVGLCFDVDFLETSGLVNFSKLSKSILNECAITWNISKEFKDAAVFDCMVRRYSSGSLGLNEVLSTFKNARKISAGSTGLRKTDSALLLNAYIKLKVSLGTQLEQILGMIHLQSIEPSDCEKLLQNIAFVITEIHIDPLCVASNSLGPLSRDDIEDYIAEEIKFSVNERLDYTQLKIKTAFPEKNQQITRISKTVQSFHSDLKKYKAYYPQPIVSKKFVCVVAGSEYILIANTLVESLAILDPETPMPELLAFYEHVRELYDVCTEAGVDVGLMIPIEDHFLPVIDLWLSRADSRWLGWVTRAYTVDQDAHFEPQNSPKQMNSSSIVDLFAAFQAALSFVSKFRFKEVSKRELLKRSFITVIHKTLQTYCKLVYKEFQEMDNQSSESNKMPQFTKSHVVKFNNIMLAQQLFESLMEQLEVDSRIPGTISKTAKITEPNHNSTTFRVKVVGARHLMFQNHRSPDAYAVLTLGGQILGATQVVRSNCHPLFHSSFSINLSETLNTDSKAFLQIQVYHDNSFGNEIPIGKCSVFLRDPTVQNFLTHNLTLNLRPQGSLALRVRRVGELDDTEWLIQRTQELLRFTLEDMIQTFTSQVFYINSSQIIGVLEKAMASISDFSSGTSFFGLSIVRGSTVTDDIVEGHLLPIFHYLDTSLGLFNQYVDRRFEEFLAVMYPQALAKDTAETFKVASLSDSSHPYRAATIKKTNELDTRGAEKSFNYRKPPALVRLIWHDILLFATAQLPVSVNLSESDLKQVQIVDSLVELCKSLFHCVEQGKARNNGISIKELESISYLSLRTSLDSMLRQQ